MELSDGVQVRYLVKSAQEARYLEDAITEFPVRIELSDIMEAGDKPKVFVTKSPSGIMIRPYRCLMSNYTFEDGVTAVHDSEDQTTVEHQGHFFILLNIPIHYEVKETNGQ